MRGGGRNGGILRYIISGAARHLACLGMHVIRISFETACSFCISPSYHLGLLTNFSTPNIHVELNHDEIALQIDNIYLTGTRMRSAHPGTSSDSFQSVSQ